VICYLEHNVELLNGCRCRSRLFDNSHLYGASCLCSDGWKWQAAQGVCYLFCRCSLDIKTVSCSQQLSSLDVCITSQKRHTADMVLDLETKTKNDYCYRGRLRRQEHDLDQDW